MTDSIRVLNKKEIDYVCNGFIRRECTKHIVHDIIEICIYYYTNYLLDIGTLLHYEIDNFPWIDDKIMENCQPSTWSNCDATTISVRHGPCYVSGGKSQSKTALYTVFAMDIYKLNKKIHEIFKYSNIDKYVKTYNVPYDVDNFPLPPLFILNVMIPNYTPERVPNTCDGNGYQMIVYAHLSKEIRQILLKTETNDKLPASIKLLKDFIHSDLVNSEIRNRFKCIARIMNRNYTDFGFLANRLISRYNSKPFLAQTSSTFYHEAGKYFAADIDIHKFGYPARQGLAYMINNLHTAIYDIAVLIEGNTNHELPEQILASCRLSKVGIDLAQPFPKQFIKLHDEEINLQKEKTIYE